MKATVFFAVALLAGMSILIGNDHPLRAQSQLPDPAETLAHADGLIETGMRDADVRGQAMFLYEEVLAGVTGNDTVSRSYQARAHLGLALIHTFDLLDLIPGLSNFLGINLSDLLGSLGGPAMAGAASGADLRTAAACTPTDFQDYLWILDGLLTNMISPIADNFRAARELDPAVTLRVSDAWVTLIPDDPATPADEELTLDLSGEWDAADAALFEGVFDALVGGVKILMSYNGPLQQLVNPTLTPGCAPAPGSDEWTSLFGQYGPLTGDGAQRMAEAQARLSTGLSALADALRLFTAETDDQSDDLLRYYDYGTDGIGPSDPGYPGPDPDGTEGNGQYDVGEPWGMDSIGELLNSLLGSLLGGTPLNLSDLSKILPPYALASLMDSLAESAQNGTPVDLIPSLLKPLFGALGMAMTDQQLYGLGLPALNLGALFIPPLPDFSVIMPLTDANGVTITQPESGDTSHLWPDGSGRVDPPNGTVDSAYSFYQDQDAQGNDVGVMGGLILNPVTTPADFDGSGNLIGAVDYEPMMNPQLNSLLGLLGGLMP